MQIREDVTLIKPKVLKIPVMEVFGPTIQGEGRVIGQKTIFVRIGGCDYKCSWCDSKFTWDGSEKATMMTPKELIDKILLLPGAVTGFRSGGQAYNFSHITLTGGNPALIGRPMADFISRCLAFGIKFSVETQGSRWQDWFYAVDDVCLSPKPPSSGMSTDYEVLKDIIDRLSYRQYETDQNVKPPYLKVVVFNDEDFDYAKDMHKRFPALDFFVSVGNSDVVTDDNQGLVRNLLNSYDWLVSKILNDPDMNKVKPLPQLHTLLWGNRRGV